MFWPESARPRHGDEGEQQGGAVPEEEEQHATVLTWSHGTGDSPMAADRRLV